MLENGDIVKTDSKTGIRVWLVAVPVLLLLTIGLAIRLKIAWLDHRFLMSHFIWVDDSFLCMTIARNLAAGLGMTSDGVHVTNGFQPLYVFLLVPIFKIIGQSDIISPIHWAATMQATIATAAGWVYYCIARRAFNRGAAFWVLFFWAVSHYFVVSDINGMETSLYGLMIGLVVWFYLTRFIQSDQQKSKDYIYLGILAGLTLLTRIDAGFLLLAIGIDWYWRHRQQLRQRYIGLLWASSSCLVVLSPWLTACLLIRGTIAPDSGQAVRFLSAKVGFNIRANYFHYQGQDSFEPQDVPWQYYAENVLDSATLWAALTPMTSFLQGTERTYIIASAHDFPVGKITRSMPLLILLTTVLFLACWMAWPLARSRIYSWLKRGGIKALKHAPEDIDGQRPGDLDFLRLPIVFWALAYCFHVFGFWYYCRYYYPAILIFTLFSGWFIDIAIRILFSRRQACRIALSGVLIATYGFVFYLQMGHYLVVDERELQYNQNIAIVPWIERNIPKDARLGSFQSGMFSYFCPHTCINLDGVVNHDALVALQERHLWSYIREQKIAYIVDVPLCLNCYLETSAGVDPIPIELIHSQRMKVYRVLDRPNEKVPQI